MSITYAEKTTYEHKDHSDWRDHPRWGKDLFILRIEKGSLSLILWD
jgi:hypothetical protein